MAQRKVSGEVVMSATFCHWHIGVSPYQLIHDLVGMAVFVRVDHSIKPEVASVLCEKHGFKLIITDPVNRGYHRPHASNFILWTPITEEELRREAELEALRYKITAEDPGYWDRLVVRVLEEAKPEN